MCLHVCLQVPNHPVKISYNNTFICLKYKRKNIGKQIIESVNRALVAADVLFFILPAWSLGAAVQRHLSLDNLCSCVEESAKFVSSHLLNYTSAKSSDKSLLLHPPITGDLKRKPSLLFAAARLVAEGLGSVIRL